MGEVRVEIAKKKLGNLERNMKILFRFASIAELSGIVNSGVIPPCEACNALKSKDLILRPSTQWWESWEKYARSVTNWDHLVEGVGIEKDLISLLRKLKAKKLGKGHVYLEIQAEMRNILLKYGISPNDYIGGLLHWPLKMFLEKKVKIENQRECFILMLYGNKNELLGKLEEVMTEDAKIHYEKDKAKYKENLEGYVDTVSVLGKILSEDEVSLFVNLIFDGSYLKSNPKMLKQAIRLVAKLRNLSSGKESMASGFGQAAVGVEIMSGYEVVLIYALNTPHGPSFFEETWSEIESCKNADNYILGVIVMLKDKEVTQQVAEMVSAEGSKINVPVFNTNGQLFWPN